MEKFAIIIPDRCDRPEFLEHCLFQMDRQTLKPDRKYIINYFPESKTPDLVTRVRCGVEYAVNDGIDIVYIIENDDYYPDDYFEKNFIGDYDFVGIPFTHYYHIMTGGHLYMPNEHQKSSSLFCTGLRVSVIKNFQWSMVPGVVLDRILWKYAVDQKCKCNLLLTPALPIGIKHGLGLCPGAGHNTNFYSDIDKDFAWLRSKVRPESFDFYMDIKNKYGP